MYQPNHQDFQPATYQCADCEIEHNGDRRKMPAGWDRVRDPHSRQVSLRCPDCLERIEREWAAGRHSFRNDKVSCPMSGAFVWQMGLIAAAYVGGLGR